MDNYPYGRGENPYGPGENPYDRGVYDSPPAPPPPSRTPQPDDTLETGSGSGRAPPTSNTDNGIPEGSGRQEYTAYTVQRIIDECSTDPNGYFQCENGNPYPCNYLCDGNNDCKDRSDEDEQLCRTFNNQPNESEGNTHDIGTEEYDRYPSRPDLEANPEPRPPANARDQCASNPDGDFQCLNGTPVPCYLLCDGNEECDDGSDEDFAVCGKGS